MRGRTFKNGGEVLPLDALPMGAGRFGFYSPSPPWGCDGYYPFNAPSNLLMQKLAPAIAMGNAVIIKPSVTGIGEALMIAECFDEAGVPKGLVNVVPCRRDVAGYMVSRKDVSLITITGGTAAADALAKITGAKPFVGELGGNSANIVCSDADIVDAAKRIVPSAFEASGQQCISAQRIIVEREVLETFLEHFKSATLKLNVGDPSLETTDVGTMINLSAAERVEKMVTDSVKSGADEIIPLKRARAVVYPPY